MTNLAASKIESLPGRAGAFILDVKEVSNIKAEYFYNYYISKENELQDTVAEGSFRITTVESDVKNSNAYIKVSYDLPNSQDPNNDFLETIANTDIEISQIMSENDFAGNIYTGISSRLPNEINDLRTLIEEASSVLINVDASQNTAGQSTTDFIQSFSRNLKSNGFLFSETYKKELPKFFSSISNENLGRVENENKISYLDYEFNATHFSPVLDEITVSAVNNSTSIFSNGISDILGDIIEIKNRSVPTIKNDNNPLSNYFPVIGSNKVFFKSETIPELYNQETGTFSVLNQVFNESVRIGFVVEVTFDKPGGEIVSPDPVFIKNRDAQEIFIGGPIYNAGTSIRVRPVYAVKIPIYEKVGQNLFKKPAIIFVSGKGSSVYTIAVDKTPPPPPQDLVFNLESDGLEISWSLPYNTQRDISKFRVFRRKSLREPFTLIKQIDFGGFDDQKVPNHVNEIRPVGDLKTWFKDKTFDENSSYIYSVVCVDVHDLTSNYSEQIHVRINPVFNRLETKLFARSGAYIPYPNMTIENEEVFSDVIKSSGYRKAKIYFNPDFLKVTKTEGESETTLIDLNESSGVEYKLNLINMDLQKQQILDIIIGERIYISDFESGDSAIIRSFLDEDATTTQPNS